MQETWVQSLGLEDPLEKEMATHSSILAWKIPWREEPGRLQSKEEQESDMTERLNWTEHASKVILKILQTRVQQYKNYEFPDVQVRFRKCRGTRDQIANIGCIIKKAKEFQKKTSISALLTTPKPLTV